MRRIGFVLFPGFQVMSFAVISVFEMANIQAGERAYDIVLLSEGGGDVRASSGMAVATEAFGNEDFHTLIVGGGTEVTPATPGMIAFLRRAPGWCRRVAATCTGAFILAEAGLLDGRRATTHWAYARDLRTRFPHIKTDEDRIFVVDGPIWTSAGMTAGIDLALMMVESDLGPEIARAVAKKLVVYHRRAGGQSQHSALLAMEPKSDRIHNALIFAKSNLHIDLTVGQLAEAAHLSPRQFSPRVSQGDGPIACKSRGKPSRRGGATYDGGRAASDRYRCASNGIW